VTGTGDPDGRRAAALKSMAVTLRWTAIGALLLEQVFLTVVHGSAMPTH
jgi:hypothetical protein